MPTDYEKLYRATALDLQRKLDEVIALRCACVLLGLMWLLAVVW